jgi:hypothetical protein
MVRLKTLWADDDNTAEVCAHTLRQEYRDYPNSLTRSSILGAIKRAREETSPYYGWFAVRQKIGYARPRHAKPPTPEFRNSARPRVTTRQGRSNQVIEKAKRSIDEVFNQRRGRISGQPVITDMRKANTIAKEGQKFIARIVKPLPDSTPKSLIDRGIDDCEWPVEVEGRTMYCSCPKVKGLRYCSAHAVRYVR